MILGNSTMLQESYDCVLEATYSLPVKSERISSRDVRSEKAIVHICCM